MNMDLRVQDENSSAPVARWMALCTCGLLAVLILRRHLSKRSMRLPPGPRGWPVIGNIFDLGKYPHQSFMELAHKYGPVMSIKVGQVPTIVISSPEMAREVLQTQDHLLGNRPKSSMAELVFYNTQDIVFAPLGDNWRFLRKVSVEDVFSAKCIAATEFIRKEEIMITIQEILEDSKEDIIELNERIRRLISCMQTRTLFRKRYRSSRAVKGKNVEAQSGEEATDVAKFNRVVAALGNAGHFVVGDYIPSLARFDIGGQLARMKEIHKELDEFLTTLLADHKANLSKPRSAEEISVVDLLLLNHGNVLSSDQIKAYILDILLAGIDTIGSEILWVLLRLMRHPEVRQKVLKELDDVVGRERLVEESDLVHLKYLSAVIRETCRLHPIIPILFPHSASQATKVAGYDIPEGCTIFVNVYAIQRSPKVWQNPLDFNPDRFLNSSIDLKGQNFEFIPYSAGRRICPGIGLSLRIMESALARLLQICEFSLPSGMEPEDVDLTEEPGITSPPNMPLAVLVTPRLPLKVFTQEKS